MRLHVAQLTHQWNTFMLLYMSAWSACTRAQDEGEGGKGEAGVASTHRSRHCCVSGAAWPLWLRRGPWWGHARSVTLGPSGWCEPHW